MPMVLMRCLDTDYVKHQISNLETFLSLLSSIVIYTPRPRRLPIMLSISTLMRQYSSVEYRTSQVNSPNYGIEMQSHPIVQIRFASHVEAQPTETSC
jgi:hypothetical protein